MKRISGKHWDEEVRSTLADAALSGGAILDVEDNLQVLVLDVRLWESLEGRLPSLSEIIREMRVIASKG